MKKIGLVLLVLAVMVAGALVWLHGNLDALVQNAIARYGSEMTQARVTVGGVKISAVNGEGVISDLVIGNPKGFKTAHAFKVREFTVAIDPASIAGNVVTVRTIAIIAPEVTYEKGGNMTNFDAIQNNIAAYLGQSSGGGKKLIVLKLTMRDARAVASAPFMYGKTMTANLPDLTLHDLGKARGGITPGELGQEIAGAMKHQLSDAIRFDRLAKTIGKEAGAAAKSAGNSAGAAADKLKSLF